MFVFGGKDGNDNGNGNNLNDVHKLNLNTNTWSGPLSTTGTAPSARWIHTSVVHCDVMVVFGGHDSYRKNDLHKLNLNTNAWSGAVTTTGTAPTGRYLHTAVIHGGFMFVFGGFDGVHKNDLHKLNLNTNAWSGAVTTTGTAPTARQGHTSMVHGDFMIVFISIDECTHDRYTVETTFIGTNMYWVRTDYDVVQVLYSCRLSLPSLFDQCVPYVLYRRARVPLWTIDKNFPKGVF